MKIKSPQYCLGIDPGVAMVGWGIIKKEKDKIFLMHSGCIKTAKTLPLEKRLEHIYQEIKRIIQKFQPQTAAVEQLFFYKNVKTAIAVSQARGVILLACSEKKIPLQEFTPLEVKLAICGYGLADKQQVQKMVKIILKLTKLPEPDDMADALAIAICGLVTKKLS